MRRGCEGRTSSDSFIRVVSDQVILFAAFGPLVSKRDWPTEVKEVLKLSSFESFVSVFLSMPLGRLGAMKNEARLLMPDPVSDGSKERLEPPLSDESTERVEPRLDCSLLASVMESPSDRFIDPT
jgi:hypothetical protein